MSSLSPPVINPIYQQNSQFSGGIVTPNISIKQSGINTIPVGQQQLSTSGFVTPNSPIISYNNPVVIPPTVNSPQIPINYTNISPISNNLRPPSPQITLASQNNIPVFVPSSPNARTTLLNLNTSRTNEKLENSPKISIAQATSQTPGQATVLLPKNNISSVLPLRPTVELMNQDFVVKDYQGIITNSSLENELLNAGYAPLSKIVIRAENGQKRTQYIKAVNKKGQKVFILIDVNGYTTARSSDLTLIESNNSQIIPYSIKTGAYQCADKDVCGVAFECGSDGVCVLTRNQEDLTPKEANFVFVEQHAPSSASIETEDGTIMSYPVIRLSEIRANPSLVFSNTDTVTRRLRNSSYSALLAELTMEQQSIINLNAAFNRFNIIREKAAVQLKQTLTKLENWNDVYINNPPTNDEFKDKYRDLQYNLAHRNDDIATLLRLIKKVSDKRIDIDLITKEINDIAIYAEEEFENVQYAVTEKPKIQTLPRQ